MNYQNIIHSIDIDGVKYSGEIDSNLIGPELGKMKHEGTYSDAVFIAPKIYGLYNNFSMPIIKTKGLKKSCIFLSTKNFTL
jgi:hypothetical protein